MKHFPDYFQIQDKDDASDFQNGERNLLCAVVERAKADLKSPNFPSRENKEKLLFDAVSFLTFRMYTPEVPIGELLGLDRKSMRDFVGHELEKSNLTIKEVLSPVSKIRRVRRRQGKPNTVGGGIFGAGAVA